jgi:type IV pilus assembly protein PilY1
VTRPFRAERVITDPLATTSGVVFFTTYKPYADECALGGKSFLWALRYNTGDAPSYAVMKGKALVQVSTASVEQIDLSKAFRAEFGGGMGGRRTGAMEGVPPTAQGLSLLSQPPPVKRIMHMMER